MEDRRIHRRSVDTILAARAAEAVRSPAPAPSPSRAGRDPQAEMLAAVYRCAYP
jgi:hypothetical protein